MNRAQRRATGRRITRELHADYGCTCRPTVAPLTDQLGEAAGEEIRSTLGGRVFDTLHEHGCPLGAMGAEAIEHGIVLAGWSTTAWRRCER